MGSGFDQEGRSEFTKVEGFPDKRPREELLAGGDEDRKCPKPSPSNGERGSDLREDCEAPQRSFQECAPEAAVLALWPAR